MKLRKDERGVVIAYLTTFFIIIAVALFWIVMNEMLLRIGDWANTGATESFGFTHNILILLWRATPIVLLFGSVMWAILQAHRSSGTGG